MGPQDLLDALDEIVYVSDPNTYELLYGNRRCRSLLPTRDYKGKPCYALLQGQPAPCPYCTNARLTPDKFYVWEFNNPSMGRHFLLKDKLIDWDGRPARLEIAVDITEQELLSQDTARKLETERTLVECIRRLMDAASSREAAQAVLSCVGGFYQASHAFLLELHASGRSVHCTQMWTAADAEPLELPSISLSNGSLLNRLLESPQAQCILAERLGPEYRQVAAQMQDAGVSALLFAPLPHTFGRGLLGVANAASGINDTRVLESLAYFVGSELSRRRLQSRLEYQNRHDALTGLENRLQYQRFLAGPIPAGPIGAVFCDINSLKQINDRYGHSRGDAVIMQTADVLRACFPGAHIYRMSGDEFVVLCPGVTQARFETMLAKARDRLASETDYGVSLGGAWHACAGKILTSWCALPTRACMRTSRSITACRSMADTAAHMREELFEKTPRPGIPRRGAFAFAPAKHGCFIRVYFHRLYRAVCSPTQAGARPFPPRPQQTAGAAPAHN